LSPKPELNWLSIALATLPLIGVIVGVLLKSWIDRKSRRDALAIKILEAKLRGYDAIAMKLEDAYLSVMREIQKIDEPSDKLLRNFWALRDAEVPYSHLWSQRVAQGINALYSFHADVYQRPRELGGSKEDEDKLRDIFTEIRQAIREDCGTDAITEHIKDVLVGSPSLLRLLLKRMAELDETPPSGTPPKLGA